MNIAETILFQIRNNRDQNGNSGLHLLMCWGAQRFQKIPASDKHDGGLRFYVAGLKFHGWVNITLSFDDTYKITFTNRQKTYSMEMIYCDQLLEMIDREVET